MKFPRVRREPSPGDGLDPVAPTRERILTEVGVLLEEGRPDEAVDLLAAAARTHRDPEILIRLRDIRRLAARSLPAIEGRDGWPPAYDDPFPDVAGQIPEIRPHELTTDILGGAVLHHGALCVRALLDQQQVATALDAIRRAQQSQAHPVARPDEWYDPVDTGRTMDDRLREKVKAAGGTWLADSPAASATIMHVLDSTGVARVVQGYFGERPYFSLQKSTLRCVQPEARITGWHQDGSFLDADVRTMNLWVALSHCGGDYPASGLEILPDRVDQILPTSAELGRAPIDFDLIDDMAARIRPVRPRFQAGDALLFDEHLVHRTSLDPGLTEARYALECWLFAPSHTSASYTSFLV